MLTAIHCLLYLLTLLITIAYRASVVSRGKKVWQCKTDGEPRKCDTLRLCSTILGTVTK